MPTDYPLGEVRTGADVWDNGALPEQVPLPVIVGTADCIANGEQFKESLPFEQTINGWPKGCFLNVPVDSSNKYFLARIKSCRTQVFYARLIQAMYADDDATIVAIIRAQLGAAPIIEITDATDLFPAIVCIVGPDYAACVTDGTRNFQQLALQAAYGLVGPLNFGAFGTQPLWYAASQRSLDALSDAGCNFSSEVTFAGHSYGAVVAELAAVRIKIGTPGSRRNVITFGMPKPGNQALEYAAAKLRRINIIGDTDPIPILPPNQILTVPLWEVIGATVLAGWNAWIQPIAQAVIDSDGNMTIGRGFRPDTDYLEAIVDALLAAHRLSRFCRIRLTSIYVD